jgi:hypothetical protein
MRHCLLVLLLSLRRSQRPDPANGKARLGYKPVAANLVLPDGMKMGAPSSVALDAWPPAGFNRGEHPLMEFDAQGKSCAHSEKAVPCVRTACESILRGKSGPPTSTAHRDEMNAKV